jgi:cytochrome c oxidase cbb3-type subunit 1
MNANPAVASLPFGRTVALHSLAWLVAANVVGIWLAVSLLWPAAGDALAPLTYGRWTPLHLDWQLYGWCALPVTGMLVAWFFDAAHPQATRDAAVALGAWSAALVLGGMAWLGGHVSGKLFLDWHGWARPLLPLSMYLLWTFLAGHTWRRWPHLPVRARALRAIVLGLLLVVPAVLYWSTGRTMYQRINPDSGGATGTALLGSTLGVITIFMLAPLLLGVAARRRTWPFACALATSWLVFAALDRGNVSHHATGQILALATLLAWIPLLPWFWRRFAWPEGARPWLRAAIAWWMLLVVTGWISFLPGISESLKYTHALVGHAHLAMAGLLTSLNATILIVLTGFAPPRKVFWLWQAGCMVFVVSMLALGLLEPVHTADLYRSESWTQMLLGLRLVAGVAMTAASVRWLAAVLRS